MKYRIKFIERETGSEKEVVRQINKKSDPIQWMNAMGRIDFLYVKSIEKVEV